LIGLRLFGVAIAVLSVGTAAGAQSAPAATLLDAQRLFYNAHYEAAASLMLTRPVSENDDLASLELRSTALLFQLKRLLEGRPAKDDALKQCETCEGLMKEFFAEIQRGQTLARERLRANPLDDETLFFLGKLDLNYVWLQLGPLKRKTGWDEYWEARKSLDTLLARNPGHVRARVARAWIDYIVDTKMPWGTRWMLGGGNRKKALTNIREAARVDADFFTHAEAEFALWDMQVRERDMSNATDTARRLARDFPENRELATFLAARGGSRGIK
jgi:hypothetical protein